MTKYTLAVDPGKLLAGVAIFSGNTLAYATLARNPTDKPGSDGPGVWARTAAEVERVVKREVSLLDVRAVILETPVIRRQGLQSGDQKDVLCLAGVDGAIAALFLDSEIFHTTPEGWGGQTPKEIKNARTLKRLTPDELQAIDPKVPKSLRHNVLDGIAIGLFYLGRYR